MNISIHTGKEAHDLISSSAFGRSWDKLHARCPWSTVFQNRAFVSTWYQEFRHAYIPILVLGSIGNKLKALLTLAIKADDKRKSIFIVAAGHGEADCQGWLSSIEESDTFIKASLKKLSQHYPDNPVLIRHIPETAPMEWVNGNQWSKKHCIAETFRRPLVDLANFTISKRNRKRLNRLLTLGEFVIIRDKKEFERLLPEITTLYDFRQGAMFNRTPYRNNLAYTQFLSSLFDRGLIEVAVLKSKEQVISCLILSRGDHNMHLGAINAHSPCYADYSPGHMIFLWLCQKLKATKTAYLDLTPGEDEYKDRMANQYDEVKTLIVSHKRSFFIKRQIRKAFHRLLLKAGIRPLDFQLKISKLNYLLKEKGWGNYLWDMMAKRLFHITTPDTFIPIRPVKSHIGDLIIQENSLSDLMAYRYTQKELTKWEFLENAMHHLEKGMTAYTFCKNNELLLSIWLDKTAPAPETPHEPGTAENTHVIRELYVHPSSTSLLKIFLQTVISQVQQDYGKGDIFLLTTKASAKIIDKQLKETSNILILKRERHLRSKTKRNHLIT